MLRAEPMKPQWAGKRHESRRVIVPCLRLLLLISVCCQTQTECLAQRPELEVQSGHSAPVLSVAFSPTGTLLATQGQDHTIRLWEVSTGSQLRSLKATVLGSPVSFSQTGRLLVAGNEDAGVNIWDVDTASLKRTLKVPGKIITSATFSPDGKLLATATDAVNPDDATGRTISYATIQLWDVNTWTQLRTLTGTFFSVSSLAFSADGKHLATTHVPSEVRVWDLSGDSKPLVIAVGGMALFSPPVFSPDGKLLVVATDERPIKILNSTTGRKIAELQGKYEWIRSLAFSPDGTLLAGGGNDGMIHIWDRNGSDRESIEAHAAWVNSVAFSPDGKFLASGSEDYSTKLWDLKTRSELRTLKGLSYPVNATALSPDRKLLATANKDGTVKLWDLDAGIQVAILEDKPDFVASIAAGAGLMQHKDWSIRAVTSLAFSPDSKMLATGSNDRTVRLWDCRTGSVRKLRGHKGAVRSVAFSPDGETLASGGAENEIKLWTVRTGSERSTLDGGNAYRTPIAFSPDGKLLASVAEAHEVKLWDLAFGTELEPLRKKSGTITSVSFSPDSKRVAAGDDDGTVVLWDLSAKSVAWTASSSAGWIDSLAFSPDGRLLASPGKDETIDVRDVTTGANLYTLKGHSSAVTSLVFDQSGQVLASSSDDGSVKLWSTKSQAELVSLMSFGANDWAAVAPDGLFDGSAPAWSRMLWRFNGRTLDHVPVEAFFNDFFHPGILSELHSGKRPVAPTTISDRDIRRPSVSFRSPEPQSLLTSAEHPSLTVELEITQPPRENDDHAEPVGAKDVRLFRNGSLVQIWHGEVLQGSDSVVLRAQVPLLVGNNRLTAYAFNHDNVKSTDAELVVKGPNILDRPSQMYIVSIGVNDYSDQKLDYAVPDATFFAKEVADQQREVGNYGEPIVVPLVDAEADKPNILSALQRFSEKDRLAPPPGAPKQIGALRYAEPGDAVIFYFAGHGTALSDHFYLLPYGFVEPTTRDTASIAASVTRQGISDEDLAKAFESIAADKILLVIDSCDSGQALGRDSEGKGPMNSRGVAQLAYDKGMYVLAASEWQALEEEQLGHGLLTFALVDEGLKQGKAPRDSQGDLTERSWLEYATNRVPELQTQIKTDVTDVAQSRSLKKRDVSFEPAENTDMQRPRLFYKREMDIQPLIVARTLLQSSPLTAESARLAKPTADEFMQDLQAHRFAAAYERFSSLGKRGRSATLLESVWQEVEKSGGTITGWRMEQYRNSTSGEEVDSNPSITLVYKLESPKGYLAIVFALSEASGKWEIDEFEIRNDLKL
jgi:WD40 repeat protein/uncharacterized caspase-like protein